MFYSRQVCRVAFIQCSPDMIQRFCQRSTFSTSRKPTVGKDTCRPFRHPRFIFFLVRGDSESWQARDIMISLPLGGNAHSSELTSAPVANNSFERDMNDAWWPSVSFHIYNSGLIPSTQCRVMKLANLIPNPHCETFHRIYNRPHLLWFLSSGSFSLPPSWAGSVSLFVRIPERSTLATWRSTPKSTVGSSRPIPVQPILEL